MFLQSVIGCLKFCYKQNAGGAGRHFFFLVVNKMQVKKLQDPFFFLGADLMFRIHTTTTTTSTLIELLECFSLIAIMTVESYMVSSWQLRSN